MESCQSHRKGCLHLHVIIDYWFDRKIGEISSENAEIYCMILKQNILKISWWWIPLWIFTNKDSEIDRNSAWNLVHWLLGLENRLVVVVVYKNNQNCTPEIQDRLRSFGYLPATFNFLPLLFSSFFLFESLQNYE